MSPLSKFSLAVAAICMTLSGVAIAEVPADQAAQLGKTLTCMGAPKAASKDGLIPAWTGKWAGTPPGINFTPHVGDREISPYAAEKPLFIISNANVAKYKDHLTPGELALFHKYSNYTMRIYPSHRDWRYPTYTCPINKYNAIHATITNDQYGDLGTAKSGGAPFPFPATGIEMIENQLTALTPWSEKLDAIDDVDVLPDGSQVWGRTQDGSVTVPDMPKNIGHFYKGVFAYSYTRTLIPLRERDSASTTSVPVDFGSHKEITWTYDPGTRRMSQVPVFGFDQPMSGTDGAMTIDSDRMFNGSPARYNWKILKNREIYMPADDFAIMQKSLKYTDIIGRHFPNPKYVRWELQRVYVLEGTLRKGYRHIYKKRVLYINRDTDLAEMTDLYDAQGTLWRTAYGTTYWGYDAGAMEAGPEFFFDLESGSYLGFSFTNERKYAPILNSNQLPLWRFSPGALKALANS